MDYACWSGADCNSIQPDGACFQPNTLFAHASYAFNSFLQKTKAAGGTCEFGGSAILVTVDPTSAEAVTAPAKLQKLQQIDICPKMMSFDH
ncbi:hypothetical protein SO802_008057 [Lithocarpus litseifolius]|uniref:X8 domain-containing protein n=1 Tax=Lithocarpus litseifolius TaxID=425828 RepID=A0AAW2D7I3_9ROSI